MTLAVLFLGNDRSELGVALCERPRPLCSSQGWEEKGMEKSDKVENVGEMFHNEANSTC